MNCLPLALLALASSTASQAPEPIATPAAPTQAEVDAAVQRAAELLVHNQERYERDRPVGVLPESELGAWQAKEHERLEELRAEGEGREWPYEGVYRVRGVIPAGYRVGGTAICCLALAETPGLGDDEARRAALDRGVDFCLELLAEDPTLEPGPKRGYDVRGWGHAYALRLFLRLLDLELLEGDRRSEVEKMLPHLIHCLEVNALKGGGWNYAGGGCSPFMTSSTLIALFHARARQQAVDEEIVVAALDALERARHDGAGAFAYSGAGEEPMASSAARAAIAELVLVQAGRSDVARLHVAVEGFFDNWEHLLARKSRQGTHEPPYGIAPYYFYYGHTYAGLAIEHLPEADRAIARDRLRELLWRTLEEERNGWNDRVFPRTESYSTAMAMLALLAPSLPAVETWEQ